MQETIRGSFLQIRGWSCPRAVPAASATERLDRCSSSLGSAPSGDEESSQQEPQEICDPGSHQQDRALWAHRHRDWGSRGLEMEIGCSPRAGSSVQTLGGSPTAGVGLEAWASKENEECAAATRRYLPAGKEPVLGASQGGDFWYRWLWRGPAAVQAGESTRTSLRLFLAGGEQGGPAGTQFCGGHSAAGGPRTVSAPRISQDIYGSSMSLAPSGMASGGCWVLLSEVWDKGVGTPEYPANSFVVFPPETRLRSFLWHSSRLALPWSVTRGQRWLVPLPRTTLNTSCSPAKCRFWTVP